MKKERNVEIYSIGLFAQGYEDKYLQIEASAEGVSGGGKYFSEYTLDDYMQRVSSNYPKASELGSPGTKASDDYVRYASNLGELKNAFNYVITQTQSSLSELNEDAELRDYITDIFDLSNATVSAQVISKMAGADRWNTTHPHAFTGTVTLDKDNRLVSATGFDYAGNNVLTDSATGAKLVVTVSGLTPKTSGTGLATNVGETSGIYDGNYHDRAIAFVVPTIDLTLGSITKLIDFNAKIVLATGAKAPVVQTKGSGTFGLTKDAEAYYQLTSPTLSAGGTLNSVFTAAAVARIYGTVDGKTGWNTFTVIPASSIYFDDDLKDIAITSDGNGKSDSSWNTKNTTALTKGDTLTFTFTGSRIDVYCTTDSDNGFVSAKLKYGDTVEKSVVMNNRLQSGSFYNVPTLSFTVEHPGETYTLEITNSYGNYRLDGVRVYNSYSKTAATFENVRAILLEGDAFQSFQDGETEVAGAVFVDNVENATFADYKKAGPKNEVYLDKGQAVAFTVSADANVTYQIGLSAPEGEGGSAAVSNGTSYFTYEDMGVVDMYYDVMPTTAGVIVVKNTGDHVISVTNIKAVAAPTVDTLASVPNKAPTLSFAMNRTALVQYVETFDAPVVTEPEPSEVPEPSPEASPEVTETPAVETPEVETPAVETPQPTKTPSVQTIVKQIVSSFVSGLFKSISKLFGF